MRLSLLLWSSLLVVAALASQVSELGVVGLTSSDVFQNEYWYNTVKHSGISPSTPDGTTWPIDALQNAINAGNSYAGRNESRLGTTLQPAVVYLPRGTYVLSRPIQLFFGMVLMGDPTGPPTDDQGKRQLQRRLHDLRERPVLRTRRTPNLTLVDWSVSQACQLANVTLDMPGVSTGIAMPEGGSGLIMEDLYFHGGAYHFKSLTFAGCATGILARHMFTVHCQGCHFTLCGIGVDMAKPTEGESIEGMGSFIMTDSLAARTGVTLVNIAAPNSSFASVVLENPGKFVLRGSVGRDEAWVWGKTYRRGGPDTGTLDRGAKLATSRPAPLVDGAGAGAYYRFAPPTYAEYGADQAANVKDAIIDRSAAAGGDKVLFFPYGVYLVADTLAASSPTQPAPVPMVRVGDEGDVGVAQFSDMLFTVADVLPGCTLLEVNMAGANPGDVGFWNMHFRVGGANDSQAAAKCARSDPADCKAAFMMAHFTSSSSVYGKAPTPRASRPPPGRRRRRYSPATRSFRGAPPPPPRPTGQCRMSAYQLVTGSADLRLYAGGGGFWAFFDAGAACRVERGLPTGRGGAWIRVARGSTYYLGLGVNHVADLVVRDGVAAVRARRITPGGWSANVAAYLGSV
ncbi:family 55 glycoside hydrolase [Biscogniauxia mediterranea]|nr:family 55 glycoside hydrolase [Biscogniauxia mediterranea]